MGRRELDDVAVTKLRETEKAWFLGDGTREAWFPKSQCELEENRDGTHTLTAPLWLLKEKEFI